MFGAHPRFFGRAVGRGVLALVCLTIVACSSAPAEKEPKPNPKGSISLAAKNPEAAAQKAAPEGKTGPKVGTKAPELGIKDQNGKKREWKEFLGQGKKIAVVFHRSARW
ncbi:MAG: hypothetical protein ACFCD0_12905 [Gemmataceae bacterium]